MSIEVDSNINTFDIDCGYKSSCRAVTVSVDDSDSNAITVFNCSGKRYVVFVAHELDLLLCFDFLCWSCCDSQL